MSLVRLEIKNFVIIESAEIDFAPGFTAITGETGSGKSALIGAIQFGLGHRADQSLIQHGSRRAEVALVFNTNPEVDNWLDAAGIQPNDDQTVLLRRQIEAEGRSRSWVNGASVGANQLKDLSQQLIEIHGQHGWQLLTQPEGPRKILDWHAERQDALLKNLWTDWQIQKKLAEEQASNAIRIKDEMERLERELELLEGIHPSPEAWLQIEAGIKRKKNASQINESLQEGLRLLSGGTDGALKKIRAAEAALRSISEMEQQVVPVADMLGQAATLVEESHRDLRKLHGKQDEDLLAQSDVEQRHRSWMDAANSFKCRPIDLSSVLQLKQLRLTELKQQMASDKKDEEEERSKRAFLSACEEWTIARNKAAASLGESVTRIINQLGMTGGQFHVQLTPIEPGPNGCERVDFVVSTNPGAPCLPVGEIASGGELSRLSLAISISAKKKETTSAVIFDEVDAGIGGVSAKAIGAYLRQLGKGKTILAVTHLAQVASQAKNHIKIEKITHPQGANSRIWSLNREGRILEISRMLSGDTGSPLSLKHAENLLDQLP